ncbi:uncharacterized protein LOC120177089 [Hibiscus syriacus]|uniref:uncharacterized protein LOC120177089 n=1 Tax=Hibiscus syriacus TaxID=106335 RepID=UPI00192392C8|nr:uncharacterized protein LOC120177089 [Hibiscus syriacus]
MKLPLEEFDLILGIDWLSKHQVNLDYETKRVVLKTLDNRNIVMIKERHGFLANVVAALEFPDVSLEELHGLPLDREVEFEIEVYSSSTPVSMTLYRMAPKKLKELKVIAYVSRQLKPHERNYPTHDLELDAVLLKDYDCEIKYHPVKANVVVDALSRKTISNLRALFVSLSLFDDGSMLAELQVKPTLAEKIKVKQLLDSSLLPMIGQVVVDRLTKLAHFIHVRVNYSLDKLARLYISKIFRLYGVPLSIISDRDLSTTFHPRADGRSKQVIQVLEDMLRGCVIDFHGSLEDFLPLVEFAYNNKYQASIRMAP